MTELTIAEEPTSLTVDDDGVTTLLTADEVTLQISDVGIQGPAGATSTVPGPTGPQGPQGTPGSAPQAYTHNQGTPAALWTVVHNLGYFPNVSVVDSADTVVEGSVVYLSVNSLTIEFTASFGGKAYLS